jgi:hypothetical protein
MLGDPAPTPFDRGLLRLGHDLRRLGDDPARSGWHHVRHGVWIEAATWSALTPEQRHAALVHATDLVSRAPGRHVFALESAAAVWGLPSVDPFPHHVSRLATGPRTRGSRLIRVHVGAAAEPVVAHGLLVTDVPRTVVDLARTGSLARGLAAADHALRHGLCTRAQLADAAAAMPARVGGRPRALLVAELADARSMSPGESLSRAVMFRLNLPRPDLQVPVDDTDGLIGVADFGWQGVVGEFDGRRKYGVAPGADPTEAAAVLWREKRREDRFRRQVRVARWVWADAQDDRTLAGILAEQGIRAQARNTWIDLGRVAS